MNVHYRKGKFFVIESALSDDSKVYGVWVGDGRESSVLLYNAESERDALTRCKCLHEALTDLE